eukprot:6194762-Pleurochrysis_carterae.AAC.1
MESDVSTLDLNRAVEILVKSLMDPGFSDPNDPNRARFPQLHQPANSHRDSRTDTVPIADTGPRSHPDHANPAQITSSDVRAALVDRVLSQIPCYAGAGTTLVSSIEVQLTALQGGMSQHAIESSAVLGFVRNQMYFCRQRNPVSLTVPTAVASPGDGGYVQFRGAPTTGQTFVSNVSQAQPQQMTNPA